MARNAEPTGTDEAVSLWRAVSLAHHAVRSALEQDLAGGPAPLAWCEVLDALGEAPGGRLRMQDLANRLPLSRSRVSRLVDEMVEAGLVDRKPDPADGRATLAVLTAAGKRTARKVMPALAGGAARHLAAHLSERDRATVRRVLTRVAEASEDDARTR